MILFAFRCNCKSRLRPDNVSLTFLQRDSLLGFSFWFLLRFLRLIHAKIALLETHPLLTRQLETALDGYCWRPEVVQFLVVHSCTVTNSWKQLQTVANQKRENRKESGIICIFISDVVSNENSILFVRFVMRFGPGFHGHQARPCT